jgi:putative cell wall-binding protein
MNMKKILSVILFIACVGFVPHNSFAEEGTTGTCEMTITTENLGIANAASPTNYCKGSIVGFYEAGKFHLDGVYTGQVEYSGQKFVITNPFSPNVEEILTVYTVDSEDDGLDYVRISGSNRLNTAIEVSKQGWPRGLTSSEKSVIIARADDPADALAASSLSGLKNAPILLTYSSSMNQAVLDELNRLNPKKVYFVGGAAAVGTEIERKLVRLGYKTERLAGASRFETAAKINEVVTEESKATKAIIANGYTVADALSASAYASIKGVPVYLANKDNLPVDLPNNINTVDIYGGKAVISENIPTQLKSKGYMVNRISGTNRYGTSVEGAGHLDTTSPNVILVRGESTSKTKQDYPDAVVASGLAKQLNAKILLIHPSKTPYEVRAFLKNNKGKIYVLGGESAISEKVIKSLF